MTEQITPLDLWNAVELISKRWQHSLNTQYLLIPLRELQPLWNKAVGTARMEPRERLRLEAQGHENVLLKAEIQRLKQQLELITRAAGNPATERRRNERRRSN